MNLTNVRKDIDRMEQIENNVIIKNGGIEDIYKYRPKWLLSHMCNNVCPEWGYTWLEFKNKTGRLQKAIFHHWPHFRSNASG